MRIWTIRRASRTSACRELSMEQRELDMECNEPFFLACKDSTAKLVYTFQDGREETLVIEY